MPLHKQVFGVAILCSFSAGLVAAGFDGSTPILCAITTAVACDSQANCAQGPANVVNVPVFLRFDGANKVVESAKSGGARRASKIQSVTAGDGALTFSGVDAGKGWNAVINQSTGDLSATVAEDGAGYVLFGACLAH